MSEPAVAWNPPHDVRAAIAAVRVREAQGSPEDDGRPVQLAPQQGVVALGAALKARFPLVIGPPQLRAGSAHHNPGGNRDVHEEGRAIDLMIPSLAYGEEIANFVSKNADVLGIQGVIFRRANWFSNAPRTTAFRPYGGTSPHTDHVHIEVGPDYDGRTLSQVAQAMAATTDVGDAGTSSWTYAIIALAAAGVAAAIVLSDD